MLEHILDDEAAPMKVRLDAAEADWLSAEELQAILDEVRRQQAKPARSMPRAVPHSRSNLPSLNFSVRQFSSTTRRTVSSKPFGCVASISGVTARGRPIKR